MLKHAWHNGSAWITQTVDNSGYVGKYTSLALAPTAPYTPHISYIDDDNDSVKHAFLSGSTWLSEEVGYGSFIEGMGWTSLALASTAPFTVHVTAYDFTREEYYHYTWDRSEWDGTRFDSADDAGRNASLELGGGFFPRIGYHSKGGEGVRYARRAGLSWSFSQLESFWSGEDISLELEPTTPYTAHMIYFAWEGMTYAIDQGAAWPPQVVDNLASQFASLAIVPTAPFTPHVAYFNGSVQTLKHAWYNGTAWVSETVDSSASVGRFVSLALAPTAPYTPHISYCDFTNMALKHAWLSAGTWISETVDDSTDVSHYTSVALEATAPYTPHIAYHSQAALKHAWYNGTSWISETVDNSAWVGTFASLALAPAPPHTPHISYHDYANTALKHAWLSGSTWISETLDSAGTVGEYSSLALSNSGEPHIVYYDRTNGDLKYAHPPLQFVYLPVTLRQYP